MATFTTKEYDQPMAFLQKKNGNNQHFSNTTCITTFTCNNTQYGSYLTLCWIVDSGATYHISKSPLPQNKLDTNHDLVELLNGGKVEIKLTGSIELLFDLILNGVVHALKF